MGGSDSLQPFSENPFLPTTNKAFEMTLSGATLQRCLKQQHQTILTPGNIDDLGECTRSVRLRPLSAGATIPFAPALEHAALPNV